MRKSLEERDGIINKQIWRLKANQRTKRKK